MGDKDRSESVIYLMEIDVDLDDLKSSSIPGIESEVMAQGIILKKVRGAYPLVNITVTKIFSPIHEANEENFLRFFDMGLFRLAQNPKTIDEQELKEILGIHGKRWILFAFIDFGQTKQNIVICYYENSIKSLIKLDSQPEELIPHLPLEEIKIYKN